MHIVWLIITGMLQFDFSLLVRCWDFFLGGWGKAVHPCHFYDSCMAVGPIPCQSLTSTIYTLSLFSSTHFTAQYIIFTCTNFSAEIRVSLWIQCIFWTQYILKKINMNRSQVPWMLLGYPPDWVSGGDYSASVPSKCHRHPCWSGQAVNPGLPKDDQWHLPSWWIFW